MSLYQSTSRRKHAAKGASRSNPLLDRRLASAPAIKGPIVPEKELKFVDVGVAQYAMDTTGTVTLINPIGEGDDFTMRTGREVQIESVSLAGYGIPTAGTGLATQNRILLVWDNAANGALPAYTDVITAINPTAFPNVNNVARFTILWDHKYVVGSSVATLVGSPTIHQFACDLQVKSPARFMGTGATIASIQNGALLMLTCGYAAAGATAGVANISTRVTYSDED